MVFLISFCGVCFVLCSYELAVETTLTSNPFGLFHVLLAVRASGHRQSAPPASVCNEYIHVMSLTILGHLEFV